MPMGPIMEPWGLPMGLLLELGPTWSLYGAYQILVPMGHGGYTIWGLHIWAYMEPLRSLALGAWAMGGHYEVL